MNSEKVQQILTSLGLSQTEAKVYFSMLGLGPASVQNIAKDSKISRTATYEIIDALQKKGIASTFQEEKKKMFVAEDPVKLETYFKSQMAEMKDQLTNFKNVIPELRLLAVGNKPKVRYLSGTAGMEALFRDILATKVNEVLDFSDSEAVYAVLDERETIRLRGVEGYSKIPVRNLHRGHIRTPRPITKYRMIPSSVKTFGGSQMIYGNKVAYIDVSGEIDVVIIESQVFADTARAMFNLIWDLAK
ncbi:hypothetical protein CO173_00975 [Candidatus Uhrbacteria bacterium CG_4_9_14_3_um_filter_41_35]|uniref:Transcription regulator TrmB N-terminal domain-containing protein n=1 Tax=Candidatus Uhrbacteria bacterium CG_4_9_14_3_um_filter_41_35 TaxID=1975034 RepID=A0A2M7XGG9_9BACT|nr:MAG: hypothetical protein COV92_03700 [Candidatus Uhrbacteria bacterium CG11_big_fil_rev_8_21_14_0_20_41_9]PJA46945.1 MAG: hypothetical protein CO173_00975 [Candidatus Uhrbacteria bacterium CG_4_9_14_3_um_filter_41_35]